MLKANDKLKFSQDVVLNNIRDKGKPKYKLSHKVLKEEDGYDPLLDISPYTTLIQLKYSFDVIHHCVTTVGKLFFDKDSHFALPLAKYNL